MSVIKSKRKDSKVQFMQTTLELAAYTVELCRKFPKSLTFYVSQPAAQAAKGAYANVKRANSVFPKTQKDLEKRIDLFQAARRELMVLSSEMDLAYELQKDNIKESAITKWHDLLADSYKLITAQIKSDKARFQDLP